MRAGVAVFDIDGVVADVRHRLHHLRREGTGRPAWSRFFGAAAADPLLDTGARLVADYASRHEIVWLTGRPEWLRALTRDWLADHDLPAGRLYLRPDHDYRPARVYKLGVLLRLRDRDALTVAALVDDDPEVVQDARAAGFPAVLADWVPREAVLRHAQEDLGRT